MLRKLVPQFGATPFADPALYIAEPANRSAILIDCGDLSGLTPRQLLRITHVFLSHCHMDHVFAFDLLLRTLMGHSGIVHLIGPPETADRIAGKLSGYTWNLLYDQNLGFTVTELDFSKKQTSKVSFHCRTRFRRSRRTVEAWNPRQPILQTPTFTVTAAPLDHRTLSVAYAVEEKPSYHVENDALSALGVKPGPWLQTVKSFAEQANSPRSKSSRGVSSTLSKISIPLRNGGAKTFSIPFLQKQILTARPRHKIVYATDGATHARNRRTLLRFAKDADLFYAETCFLSRDQRLADETKHFTAQFIGQLAQEAGARSLVPFHFSKRYLRDREEVYREIRQHYKGNLQSL